MYYIFNGNLNKYFSRLIRFIQYELEKQGKSVEITRDASKTDGTYILTYEAYVCQFDTTGKKYIAVQTENENKFTPQYIDFLNKAEQVWDYRTNFRIGYSEFWELENEEYKDIDILSFGTWTQRRQLVLDTVENVKIIDKVWKSELHWLLRRSKIILDVNAYENSNNDMARLAWLIAMRCFVIVEKWDDPRYEYLRDKFVVVEKEKLNETCKYYLAEPLERIKWIDKSYNWLKSEYLTKF